MKVFFTKRHQFAIENKTLPLSFNSRLRTSLLRVLERHSEWGGWDNADNFTFEGVEGTLKTFYGLSGLLAYNDKGVRVPANVRQVILSGYPGHVIDVIEAWFDQNPSDGAACERELNDILQIHDSPWRIVNGVAILVDSEYLHEAVRARTLRLLREVRAVGALEEFQAAVSDLQSNETKDAVVKAHKSVESVMKAALQTDEPLGFGALLRRLIDSGMLPAYYEEFLQHFEKLALGAVKERNLPGRGHGQGTDPIEVPRSLAEFAVNLAGTINLFIIQRWIETRGSPSGAEPEPEAPF